MDIGSTAIKAAVVHGEGRLAGAHVAATGSNFHQNAGDALQALLTRLELPAGAVRYPVATG